MDRSTGRFTPKLRKLVHYQHDTCSKCGKKLPRGTPSFAAYDLNHAEIYVGDCCKAEIAELVSHIYWWWTSYNRPPPGTRLWRYMDFSKFVGMLKERALWFARADQLGDAFEGARGIKAREKEWFEHCVNYFSDAIRTIPGGEGTKKPPEEVRAEAERLYDEMESAFRREIGRTYVSCWHASGNESEALWRLYCPPPSPGVVLQTSFERLDLSLRNTLEVRFGHVQYVDFKKNFADTYDRIFWKRNSLSHEMEVRAVMEDKMGTAKR